MHVLYSYIFYRCMKNNNLCDYSRKYLKASVGWKAIRPPHFTRHNLTVWISWTDLYGEQLIGLGFPLLLEEFGSNKFPWSWQMLPAEQQLLFLEWNNFLLPNLQQISITSTGQVESKPAVALHKLQAQNTQKNLLFFFFLSSISQMSYYRFCQMKNVKFEGSITC